MAAIHWRSAQSGAFSDADDWIGGLAPGAADDAILDASGQTPYTVSVQAITTVESIQTTPTALLDVLAGFTATAGTGGGVNAGAIRVENGGTLTLQGTLDNTGSIEIFGTVSTTSIVLATGGVTLVGDGAIFLNFTGGPHQQIVAAPGGSLLTDLTERISGQGLIGGPGLSIVVGANGGFLEAKGGLLTIDTGANTIVSAGLIDAEGAPSYPYVPGQGVVKSPVENDGVVEADGIGSTMTFEKPVNGSGRAVITGGVLQFDAGFNQNVGFTRSTGVLVLARSASFTSLITGFSYSGGKTLDLRDIAFVGPREATFKGSKWSGVLTVSDGAHTAGIHLGGDFTSAVFTAADDGQGGTLVSAIPRAIHWLKPSSGSFSTAADWTDALAPGLLNDAVFDAAGGAYTVTQAGAATVTGIQLAANATISVAGVLAATAGTDGGVASGKVTIANGGTLAAGGDWNLAGSTVLNATTGQSLMIVDGALSLDGGGEILMAGSPNNVLIGSTAEATLTNVDDRIYGAGYLGAGQMVLINQASGHIQSGGSTHPLLIDTGDNTIVNAGFIDASGAGLTIASPIDNSGQLQAVNGTLTVSGTVSGAGHVFISHGAAIFAAAFNQNVGLSSLGGRLSLAQSAGFTSLILGYSAAAGDTLDLRDIAFVSAGEAIYTGTASKGVLTVSDGTHTAHINLQGAIDGATFTAASDGQGGTIVTASTAKGAAAPHALIAAMAGLGGPVAAPVHGSPSWNTREPILTVPRGMVA